jgi:3D (Asp-Asp-Asp) domain-containing protein
MIRYLILAGLLITCTGSPLWAGTLAPLKPAAPAPTLTKDKSAKKSDKTVAKDQSSTPAVKTASSLKSSAITVTEATSTKHRVSTSSSVTSKKSPERSCSTSREAGRLARLTAYWASEGDYYTSHGIASTGIHLHEGCCAVDPKVIPYGSVVNIPGLGKYLAVDTGSAVISREAARETGHTAEERSALVIDIYFESRRDGEEFAASSTKFASITWQAPSQASNASSDGRSMVAESDWNKLRNKQLPE